MNIPTIKKKLIATSKGNGALPTSEGLLYMKDIRAFLRHYEKLLKISERAHELYLHTNEIPNDVLKDLWIAIDEAEKE